MVHEDAHPFTPGRRLEELPHVLEALGSLIGQHNAQRARIDRAKQQGLSELAERFLRCASENPYAPVARLWDILSVSQPAKRAAVRKVLARLELAEFVDIRVEKTTYLLVDLTEKGWAQIGAEPPKRRGGGGIEHRHFSHWIADVGRKRGHRAELEWLVPGTTHKADAAWLVDGCWHVFEVVITSVDNLAAHLDACFRQSDAVERVTIVTPQQSRCEGCRRQLQKDLVAAPFLDRVTFETITPYLKELWP